MRGRSPSIDDLKEQLDRRNRELHEAQEQQKAASEVLGVISRSKFELQSILQSVVDTAARLCRAEKAVIFRLERGLYHFAAGCGLEPAYLAIERSTVISPGPGTLVGRAAESRQVVQIDDVMIDPLYEKKSDAIVGGFHSRDRRATHARERTDRRSRAFPCARRAVRRQGNRVGDDLRRSSGDSDRERAAI